MTTIRIALFTLIASLVISSGVDAKVPRSWSGTWVGTLADKSCASNAATDISHQQGSCIMTCARDGKGLGVMMGSKWFSFDAKGEKLGWKLLQSAKRTSKVNVIVTGKVDGGRIRVKKIELAREGDMC